MYSPNLIINRRQRNLKIAKPVGGQRPPSRRGSSHLVSVIRHASRAVKRKFKVCGIDPFAIEIPNVISRAHDSGGIVILDINNPFINRKPDNELVLFHHLVRTGILRRNCLLKTPGLFNDSIVHSHRIDGVFPIAATFNRSFRYKLPKPHPFPVKSGFSYQGTSIALTEAREIENKGGTQRIRYPDMPAISRRISFRLRLQHREMPARHQSSSFAIQDHTPPIARRNQSPAPTQRQRPDGQLTYVFGMRAFYILLVDHGIA